MPISDRSRFHDIMQEITDLVSEARGLCTGTEREHAEGYWAPLIRGSVESDTGYGPMITMEDTYDHVYEEEEEDDD
jgi:hypothetical protein